MYNSIKFQANHPELTDEFLGIHLKKLGSWVKKEEKKVSSWATKQGQRIHDAITHAHKSLVQAVGFKALLPFKHLMTKYLDKKGIRYENNIADIAVKFHSAIMGRQHFVVTGTLTAGMITTIVVAIINFFKALVGHAKEKQAAGQPLTDTEKAAMQANTIIDNAAKLQQQQHPQGAASQNQSEGKGGNTLLLLGLGYAATKLF